MSWFKTNYEDITRLLDEKKPKDLGEEDIIELAKYDVHVNVVLSLYRDKHLTWEQTLIYCVLLLSKAFALSQEALIEASMRSYPCKIGTNSIEAGAYVDSLWWIGKKTEKGIVPPPGGFQGYDKKDIEWVLMEYQEEYPEEEFVKCRCMYAEVLGEN